MELAWGRLAEHAHLVAIDLPGFGYSQRRKRVLFPQAMDEFVVRAADAFGRDSTKLVGRVTPGPPLIDQKAHVTTALTGWCLAARREAEAGRGKRPLASAPVSPSARSGGPGTRWGACNLHIGRSPLIRVTLSTAWPGRRAGPRRGPGMSCGQPGMSSSSRKVSFSNEGEDYPYD